MGILCYSFRGSGSGGRSHTILSRIPRSFEGRCSETIQRGAAVATLRLFVCNVPKSNPRYPTGRLDIKDGYASDFQFYRAASAPRTIHLKLAPLLVIIASVAPGFAQYAGPAILARGEAPSSISQPEIKFRPYLELTGTYNTGLARVAVTDSGDLATDASYGAVIAWGVSGSHSWKRTKLGLDYRGSFDHFVQKSAYDVINESLLLGVTHQVTRHILISFRESAGVFSRDPGALGLPQTVPFDPSTTYIPTTDFFDNRTMYSQSQLDLILQKTARLSFDFGADGYVIRRRSYALNGVTGTAAHGDVQYRLTRRMTIGAGYAFEHFGFNRTFGATDVHAAVGSFSMALNATTEFSVEAGASRIEMQSIQAVPVDPAIAALLGITSALQVDHLVEYTPTVRARISKTVPRGVIYLAGGKSVTPGNGLFLTSSVVSAMAGYTYTGLRRWSFNTNAMYARASVLGVGHSHYGDAVGSVAASRQITRFMHFVATYSLRKYLSPDFNQYNRLLYTVSVGFGFTPGDIPLRLW